MIQAAQPSRSRRRFAAFDVELATAGERPDGSDGPIAVACAAVLTDDMPRPVLWYGTAPRRDKPWPHLSHVEVRRLLNYLRELSGRGYTLVTWNSMGFDWDLLASESQDRSMCRQLALRHVDMMFHIVCVRGHRLSLSRAAHGMQVAGRNTQVGGTESQRMWAQGQHLSALGQLSQDVRITLDLADKCEQLQELRWEAHSGRPASLKLPQGWLTVEEAREIPPPDVSGLQRPVSRASLTAWMQDNPRRRRARRPAPPRIER